MPIATVESIKYLDELFVRAERTNSTEAWERYLTQRQQVDEPYFQKRLREGQNPLLLLGISLNGIMNGNPAKQGAHVVFRWLKFIHLVDEPIPVLAERCVVLQKHRGS